MREYDWVSYASVPRNGSDQPTGIPGGAALKRVTTNTYYNPTPDASDGSTDDPDVYHKSTSPQLKNAIASSEVSNGSQVLARSEFSYDNPSTTGNLTQQKSWDSTKGGYSNPLGANSISVTTQYNQYGGPTLTTDPRGYQTQLVYGSVSGVTDLYPTQVKTAYLTAVQRTETRQYDLQTGLPTRVTDADNNVSTATTYDAFGRPTLVRAAENKAEETRTTTEYSDSNRRVIVRADLTTVGDGKLVTIQHYDRLGRVRLTRRLEDAATQSATDETVGIKTQTRYMFSGANSYQLVSNPYRAANVGAAGSESTMGWTRSKSDNGGRMMETQTFGGTALPAPWGSNSSSTGTVATTYDANFTTVTDQAGKVRRSMTDGLGQLARVDEPDANNNLGAVTTPYQPTSYSYDALGNLTTVSQGVQTRTFTYDSLSRLRTAVNPESGTVTYQYDNNGNLTQRLDARSITTTFIYDALNRPTLKNYSDTTPDIAYFYDTQTLPTGAPSFDRGYAKGRLVGVTYGGGNAGTYRGYDARGAVLRQHQRTDNVNYLTEATYHLSGAMKTQVYPSVPGAGDRRTVTYTNDSAGRLASVSSSATTYAPAASVTGIAYSAPGGLSSETYGNSLIHAVTYNSRMQTNQIKLGTSGNPTSLASITYNYGTTNNNGNLQSTSYAGGGLSYTQTFGYDSLNRLTTSSEGATWSQTNSYDRYGNRAIVGAALSFNANNNRITNAGYVYDAVGNLINDSTQSFTYDAENKITKVNNVSAYVYDGEGQRVRKLVNENLRFVYGIGGQLVAEFSGANGTLKKEYVYGASGLVATIEPTAVNSNGTRYTTSDHLGSPRVVTNSGAAVASRHDYKPFGEEIGAGIGARTTGMGYVGVADGLRQKFTLKERDNETGLDYFLARYYSNVQGRFTSVDPENAGSLPSNPQSWNGYAYTYNNPVNNQDPDGLAVKVCGTDGQCTDDKTHLSDEEWNKRFYNDPSIKLKDGKIYKNGEFIGTFQNLGIDGAPFSSALIDAGRRPYEKGVLAFAGISLAGGAIGSVLIPAGSITTLGLGTTTATTTAVSGGSLASLSIQQLNLIIKGTQKHLLSDLFGQGMAGAQSALASGQIPAGLTRQTLLVAKEIAQRAVGTIKDKGGVQAVRLKVIEEALKKVK